MSDTADVDNNTQDDKADTRSNLDNTENELNLRHVSNPIANIVSTLHTFTIATDAENLNANEDHQEYGNPYS